MNPLSPRLGYYVIGLGIILQFLGLSIDAWMHGHNPALASQEGILSLDNPSHALLATGMGLTVIGAVLGFLAFLSRETLAALRPLLPALPALLLVVVSIGSVVFAYQVGGLSPHGHLDSHAADVTSDGGIDRLAADAAHSEPDGHADGEHASAPSLQAVSTDPAAHIHDSTDHPSPASDDGEAGVAPPPAVLPTPACPPGSLWHPEMGHCMGLVPTAAATPVCPAGTVWHPEMGHCMGLVPTAAATPVCPAGTVWHPQMGHCMVLTPTPTAGPTATPTPTCPEGFIWDLQRGHCVFIVPTPSGSPSATPTCPPGTQWHPEMGHCMPVTPTVTPGAP